MNIYHEARGESFEGQVAVAEVVLNRMAKQSWPNTACEVVWERKQFSWTINYKHKALNANSLETARKAAKVALTGTNKAVNADHYHTIDIMPPDWTDDMEVVNVIGNHIFYRSTYD